MVFETQMKYYDIVLKKVNCFDSIWNRFKFTNKLIIKHKSFSYAHTEEYEQFYKFSKIHYILTFCGVKSDVESVMLILVNIFCKKDAKIIESKANLKTINCQTGLKIKIKLMVKTVSSLGPSQVLTFAYNFLC